MYHIRNTEYGKKPWYKKTKSICPECLQPIDAEIVEEVVSEDSEKNKILIKKTCPQHGYFQDTISTNALYYKWTHYCEEGVFSFEKDGAANPPDNLALDPRGCPYNCGLCPQH
nr:hypothetical protein [Candidatus Sigynarchaeota archaeon]